MGIWSSVGKTFAGLNPVAAIANIGGGIADVIGADKDRSANAELNRLSRLSSERLNAEQLAFAKQQFQYQQDLAKQGVRWRVADAEAAGLHPLAALGVAGGQYSPVNAITESPSQQSTNAGGTFRAFSRMGQNIARAVAATQTAEERLNGQAQRDMLKAQAGYYDALTDDIRNRRGDKPSNPGMANPYGGTTSDVMPYQDQWFMGPDGPELGYTRDYGMSLMTDPMEMRTKSMARWLKNRFYVPMKDIWNNMRHYGPRHKNKFDMYYGN